MGDVESAIRRAVHEAQVLRTPSQGNPFTVGTIRADAIVLILGNGHRTTFSWSCLEGVVPFLRGKGWVTVGTVFAPSDDLTTLDGYLKQHVNRATANYVAVLLEHAGIVELDRGRPIRVRLLRESGIER